MTRDDDFIGQLEGYLDEYEGLTPLPVAVRDAIRAELPTTRQSRPLGGLLGRSFVMNSNLVRFGIAAAAVVLVALLGFGFLPWSNIGGPMATPEPTPSSILLRPADVGRLLGATTYRVAEPFGEQFTITLPGEWSLSTLDQATVRLRAGSGLAFRDAYLAIELIENVIADVCYNDEPMDPAGPSTVDGYVAALTNVVNFTAGPVSVIRFGGYVGKTFILTNTVDHVTVRDCDDGAFHLWTIRGGGVGEILYGGGTTQQISVIDVAGTTVLIHGQILPTASAPMKAEIQGIIESIRFE
jgi:hypothetical protein